MQAAPQTTLLKGLISFYPMRFNLCKDVFYTHEWEVGPRQATELPLLLCTPCFGPACNLQEVQLKSPHLMAVKKVFYWPGTCLVAWKQLCWSSSATSHAWPTAPCISYLLGSCDLNWIGTTVWGAVWGSTTIVVWNCGLEGAGGKRDVQN